MQGWGKSTLTNHFARWINDSNYRKGENFIFIYILKQKYVSLKIRSQYIASCRNAREEICEKPCRLSGGKGIAEIFLSIFKTNFHIGETLGHVVQVGLGGRDTIFPETWSRVSVVQTKDHPRSPQLTCRPNSANKPANTTWFGDVKSSLFRVEFRRHFLSCFLETFSRKKENRMKTLLLRHEDDSVLF